MDRGAFHRQSIQRHSNRYSEQYAHVQGHSSFPQQYTQYEEPNNYYDMQSHDQGYYELQDGYYDPHAAIQDEGEYYDDGMDLRWSYGAQEQMGNYPQEMGYYSQQYPLDPYFDDGMEYYDDNQYPMENSYDLYGKKLIHMPRLSLDIMMTLRASIVTHMKLKFQMIHIWWLWGCLWGSLFSGLSG